MSKIKSLKPFVHEITVDVHFSKKQAMHIRKLGQNLDLRVITPKAMVRLGEQLFTAKLISAIDLMSLLQPGFNQNYGEVAAQMGVQLKQPPALMNAIQFYYESWQKKIRQKGVNSQQRLLARREYHLMLALQKSLGLPVDGKMIQAKKTVIEDL
ncbi:hypothetical protein AVI51_01870 [Piscirickettsia salmonis]|uniref:Uncharacterized protein n=1 Tax=Piscirickettsia salmonis TaxID=1238 RepID=A0A9Q5VKB5_PISSA|nr:hypothetical protein [Piscirickettsia salmonis]ALA24803.1 alkaline phosphatase [Piscirickettsia salmonis]APS45128.1 hypothetical protein AVI48_12580 [Piscirickettsia salmonis]APS48488.1 hypothetical protein AVI49_13190 [Piscirickettsia salmonis]APS49750.1 hypothetical protein AVI50_01915 [Piscirickettsia salmonis]APS52932.1 hypothetical protein AVI51_01870 [Piscirickettsia salmonis]